MYMNKLNGLDIDAPLNTATPLQLATETTVLGLPKNVIITALVVAIVVYFMNRKGK